MTRIKHIFDCPWIGPIKIPRLIFLFGVLVPAAFLVVLREDVTFHVSFEAKLEVRRVLLVHHVG